LAGIVLSKQLSYKQKNEWYPLIIDRDGYRCFYCKKDFEKYNPSEYDHLNNNSHDNRPENLVLTHHSCNIIKKTSPEWQILANQQLEENERSTFGCERKNEHETLTEQIISQTNRDMTKTFLLEHTINGKTILLKDAVNAITHLCNDNNNTGSQAAIRRYIDVLCNPYTGNFILVQNPDGKLMIGRKLKNHGIS